MKLYSNIKERGSLARGRLLLGICVDESALGDGFKCGGKKAYITA